MGFGLAQTQAAAKKLTAAEQANADALAKLKAGATPTSTAANLFGGTSSGNQAIEDARQMALLQGANAAAKSNESQFQDTAKTSNFASQGSTQQDQTQNQTQNTVGTQNQQTQQNQASNTTGQTNSLQNENTNQNQVSTGTSNQNQVNSGVTSNAQQSVNTGQQQTGVVDTLNFGKLLQDQTGQAKAATGTQQTFLSDLVANGDPAFNQKMDTAIRASQSGQVQNSGENAKARIGAYAAEKVAQDNQNLRLSAAQQLAGPTAVTTLAGAGNPYLGQTATNTNVGNITGTTANNNVSNTTGSTTNNTNTVGNTTTAGTQNTAQQNQTAGTTNSATQSQQLQNTLSKLLSNETSDQQGVSGGLTSVNSVGKQPVQQSGGGMSVICTVLQKHGLLDTELVRAEVAYFRASKDKHFNAWKAYYAWGRKFAKWLDGRPVAMGLTAAVVKRLIAVPAGKGGFVAKLCWHTLLFGHHVAGWFVKDSVWDADFYNQSLEYGTNLFYGE